MNKFLTTFEKMKMAQVKGQKKKDGYQKCTCGSHYRYEDYCPYCQPVNELIMKAKSSNLMEFRKNNEGIHLGIELEVGGFENKNLLSKAAVAIFTRINPFTGNQLMEIKQEYSVPDGMELISQPLTLQEHQSFLNWPYIFEVIQNYGRVFSQYCSMHVHVDRFSPLFCKKLWQAVNYDYKKEFLAFSKEKEIRKNYSDFEESDYENRRQVREVACNLMNENTVEIRVFRQPKNYEEFMAMLELTQKVVKSCLNG